MDPVTLAAISTGLSGAQSGGNILFQNRQNQ